MAQALSQCLSVQILIFYPKGDSSLDSPCTVNREGVGASIDGL